MAFFATIVATLILNKTITNYISLESSWPVDYNVYFNVLVIIVTWRQAIKVPLYMTHVYLRKDFPV